MSPATKSAPDALGEGCVVDPYLSASCDLGIRGCIERHRRAFAAGVVAVDLDADDAPTVTVRFHAPEDVARQFAGYMIDGTTIAVLAPPRVSNASEGK
jgi:hypothetical protein